MIIGAMMTKPGNMGTGEHNRGTGEYGNCNIICQSTDASTVFAHSTHSHSIESS
jgi:hypothetical protein